MKRATIVTIGFDIAPLPPEDSEGDKNGDDNPKDTSEEPQTAKLSSLSLAEQSQKDVQTKNPDMSPQNLEVTSTADSETNKSKKHSTSQRPQSGLNFLI